jgi:SP family facilitated glucose transporter-like MFS transporter 8
MASDKHQNKAVRKPSIFVYLASASALLGAIATGLVLGWTSPALDSMGKNGSQPLLNDSLPRDKEVRSWIGSSMTLGGLVGALSSGPIAQFLGRKTAILLYGLPFTVGWVLLWTAKTEVQIIIARIITGVCAGLVCGTVPSYGKYFIDI